ncbi:poly-gamma-glutamate system protein [Pseudothermotoga sp. U03pept]|uniref:poly-gamma-glutamate system protein n=1 Tax=Pseudothermotoga sp. U03pept TaxID=3447012 RepID=UPI003F122FB8
MKRAIVWFIVSVIAYTFWLFMPHGLYPYTDQLYEASLTMERSINVISQKRSNRINPSFDPNTTGLIGDELTELTTTAGDLESKRSTTNPDMAALICHLLIRIGVKREDCVAIGASGSFPGLIVATMSACKAIGAKPLVICSIGASQWGANQIDFTVLDLFKWLTETGFEKPLLFSYGGSDNKAADFPEDIRNELRHRAKEYGFVLYEGVTFQDDLENFYQSYLSNCDKRIAAFVNIGGSLINIGRSTDAAMQTGLIKNVEILDPESMMGLMAQNKVPVLSLLNMRKLTTKYGLPWDPIPLPRASEERCKRLAKRFAAAE